jgi:hypothetical protein
LEVVVVDVALPCFAVDTDLDADDVDKLFFESSGPLEGVLFGIIDLPGDEDFLATGGGVFLLLGTGDFSLSDVSLFEEEL